MLVPLGVAPAYSDAKWPKDLAGAIELWVKLGHPDERVLAKAVGCSDRVVHVDARSRDTPGCTAR